MSDFCQSICTVSVGCIAGFGGLFCDKSELKAPEKLGYLRRLHHTPVRLPLHVAIRVLKSPVVVRHHVFQAGTHIIFGPFLRPQRVFDCRVNGRPAHALFLLAGVVEDAVCAVIVDQVYYPEAELASPLEVGLAKRREAK